jgi:DNA-binding MarR family transcriptional regulator
LSTEFTSLRKTNLPMVESRSLRVALTLRQAQSELIQWLVDKLRARGHSDLTIPALDFMGQLDCGINHASDVARALNVSRQMVAKTVLDLTRKGWLEQTPDPDKGNRKVIVFTAEGERVMSDARQVLAELDAILDQTLDVGWEDRLSKDLSEMTRALADKAD